MTSSKQRNNNREDCNKTVFFFLDIIGVSYAGFRNKVLYLSEKYDSKSRFPCELFANGWVDVSIRVIQQKIYLCRSLTVENNQTHFFSKQFEQKGIPFPKTALNTKFSVINLPPTRNPTIVSDSDPPIRVTFQLSKHPHHPSIQSKCSPNRYFDVNYCIDSNFLLFRAYQSTFLSNLNK